MKVIEEYRKDLEKLSDKSLKEEGYKLIKDYWEYQISYDETINAFKCVLYEANIRRK